MARFRHEVLAIEGAPQGARARRRRRLLAAAVASGVVGSSVLVAAPAGAVAASADVSVVVGHPAAAYVTNDEITFTVTGANAGPDAAEGVVLGLSLGYPLRFVSADERCERIQYDSVSVLCDVGTVASGASASVDIVVQPYSAGVYTVPAAASSTTSDPDAGDLSASDTVLVRRGPLQGERYVRGEFPGVFGRTPDAATVAFWNARWIKARDKYPRTLVDVPTAWLTSSEYRRLRVREAYTRILGRAAGTAEVTSWTGQVAGGLSFEALERRLLTSSEFRSHHPGSATVAAAYQAVLGRAPSSAEAAAAQKKLAGGATLASVVLGVQRSTESYDRIIGQRYESAVGHGPDALGRYVWQSRLRNGSTPEQLHAQLLVSQEVLNDYPMSNDEYGGYYEEFDRSAPSDGIDGASGLPIYDFTD